MRFSPMLSLAASVATAHALNKGFNYGSTFTDGTAKAQSDFEAEFKKAQDLTGTSGFTSARLYTMIQGDTTDTVISAIPAAIATNTTLLLGMWASAGQTDFDDEITALTSAISTYGDDFTSLIVGLSVGSEDLYRISPTGIENDSGAGASPDTLVSYIAQVKAISGLPSGIIGHVDTWNAWANSSNDAVISAVDWVGMDAYPYFESTLDNPIGNSYDLFFAALEATESAAGDKTVWVTETGWPVSGSDSGDAVASVANALTYWDQTGCALFGKYNTYWYTLQDAQPTTPSPSFGIIPASADLTASPLYNLTCPSDSSSSSSSSSSSTTSTSTSSSVTSSVAAATTSSSAAASSTEAEVVSSSTSVTSTTSASVSSASTTSKASASVSSASSTSKTSASVSSASTTAETSASVSSASSTVVTTAVAVGGTTVTTYQTTLITVTSCSSGCTTATVDTTSGSAYSSLISEGSASPVSASSSATTVAAAVGTHCPANLDGEYQYPHLIIPVSSKNPTTAYGTSYNGTITPTVSSIFNFDLPASYANKTCSLVFLFPEKATLTTSSYTFNGEGGFTVNEFSSPATAETTYDTVPSVLVSGLGSVSSLTPGNSYVIGSHTCAAGATGSFEFISTGGLDLSYFQDYNDGGIGAYITVC